MVAMHLDSGLQIGLLSGALAVAGIFLAGSVWRSQRGLRTSLAAQETLIAVLRKELDAANAAHMSTVGRLKKLEKDFVDLFDRLGRIELRPDAQSFDRAIDSARRGAEPEKLAEEFGLSEGEAELLARLHGLARSA